MKSSFLAVFFLVAIAACSGTSNQTGGDGGSGGTGGEQPVTSANSSTSSSSSSSSSGAGGGGGGGAMPSANKLGQVCNAMTPCPTDYVCIVLDAMATNGLCTIPCQGQMDTKTCTSANGFPGPGQGQCALQAKDAMGNITTVCAVLCGAQFNLPDACPTGLTCQDKINAMGMQGTDGKNDLCAP